MPSNFCFPPVENSLGTVPTQAETLGLSETQPVSNRRDERCCIDGADARNGEQSVACFVLIGGALRTAIRLT